MIDIASTVEFILEACETLGRRTLPSGSLDAKRVPGRGDSFIAVSATRELFLLLEVSDSTVVLRRRLRALEVRVGDDLSLVEAGTEEVIQRRFAVVALRRGYEDLAFSFGVVAATLLATLSESPSASEVVEFVDNFAHLLKPSGETSVGTIVGLWGELWMIASADHASEFAAAWHRSATDRFDFSFANGRVEVKTTSTQGRVHEFALEQLETGDAKPTWIASLAVTSDSAGPTVIDLLDMILVAVPGALAARVHRIALETVGGDIEAAQDFAFSPVGAQPVLVFNAESIPRVSAPTGSGISRVRFCVDLDSVQSTAESVDGLTILLSH